MATVNFTPYGEMVALGGKTKPGGRNPLHLAKPQTLKAMSAAKLETLK